jgi:hypothetical protein
MMSKVRVCDRCGKRLERIYGLKIAIQAFKYGYFSLDAVREYAYDKHDLCPDCMKKYEAFIKGEAIPSIEEETKCAKDLE